LVYNSFPLEESDKARVKEVIKEYCKRIGHEELSSRIEFKDEPYISSQTDHFNEDTLMDKDFIEGQNTLSMKEIAQKYSLVVILIIDWGS
jgi:hypothetical protein